MDSNRTTSVKFINIVMRGSILQFTIHRVYLLHPWTGDLPIFFSNRGCLMPHPWEHRKRQSSPGLLMDKIDMTVQ